MKSNDLIDELLELTIELAKDAKELLEISLLELNKKASLDSWSALECLEHLNLYSAFYLPEIKEKMDMKNDLKSTGIFRSGWLGNYFANAMKVNGGKFKKMKTFNDKNPNGSNLDYKTIHVFLKDQKELIELLNNSRTTDLNKIKTSITISKLIKLRLGDTFRFLIYHNERHIIQALKAARQV